MTGIIIEELILVIALTKNLGFDITSLSIKLPSGDNIVIQ